MLAPDDHQARDCRIGTTSHRPLSAGVTRPFAQGRDWASGQHSPERVPENHGEEPAVVLRNSSQPIANGKEHERATLRHEVSSARRQGLQPCANERGPSQTRRESHTAETRWLAPIRRP